MSMHISILLSLFTVVLALAHIMVETLIKATSIMLFSIIVFIIVVFFTG